MTVRAVWGGAVLSALPKPKEGDKVTYRNQSMCCAARYSSLVAKHTQPIMLILHCESRFPWQPLRPQAEFLWAPAYGYLKREKML